MYTHTHTHLCVRIYLSLAWFGTWENSIFTNIQFTPYTQESKEISYLPAIPKGRETPSCSFLMLRSQVPHGGDIGA